MKSNIIPYTTSQLRWHLTNNLWGLTDYTIDNIIKTINMVKRGKWTLDYDPMIGCTIAEMLDDLKIEYKCQISPNDQSYFTRDLGAIMLYHPVTTPFEQLADTNGLLKNWRRLQ